MKDQILYRIKFRKGEFEIEVQGDKDYVDKKFSDLFEIQLSTRTAQPITKSSKAGDTDVSKELSVREFIDQFNTQAHMDYIILIGYYLDKYKAMESFTVRDIKEAYREIREKLTNAGPFISQNVKKGFLMEAPKKEGSKVSTYSLTRKAIQFVENGLVLEK